VHSSRHQFGIEATDQREELHNELYQNAEQATQDAVHSVVIRPLISGKKSLQVNPCFTLRFEAWPEEESKPLFDYLYQHSFKPEHT